MHILLSRYKLPVTIYVALALALLLGGLFSFHQAFAVRASVQLIPLSSDPYTNKTSQHKTEVEPDTYSFGSTIVMAFQAGRFYSGGGSSNIGWGTPPNAGTTWKNGFLSGITVFASGKYKHAQ